MTALLAGQHWADVSKEYNIPEGTVRAWKSKLANGDVVSLLDDQKQAVGELLVDYLAETLLTLKVQARHFRDLKWLNKQAAHELAVLHGVQMDKVIRILEAFNRAESKPDASQD